MTPVNAAPHHTGQRSAPAGLFRAPTIQPWHLDRLAVVYVRQSTAQQVAENKESADRQYGLVNRAIELGFQNSGSAAIKFFARIAPWEGLYCCRLSVNCCVCP